MKHDDHTWKMRVHDSGMLRVLLQWQMHRVVKASLNTTVKLQDLPAGKISTPPLGLAFEVKY